MKEKNSKLSIEKTKDGSHTLYSNRFNQLYHNSGGAISESRHVFFNKNGLKEALSNSGKINILEVGFGTGLNLMLLLDEYEKANSSTVINYHTVEAFPASPHTIEKLNYKNFINHSQLFQKLPPVFRSLKKGKNNFQIQPNISLTIFYGNFDSYNPDDLKVDYIFHDAFSPNVNSVLWTDTVFRRLLSWSKYKAILSTYCAASVVRGAMAFSGWKVARAPGALKNEK